MEQHSTDNHILKMIKMFVELKLNMQAILDTYFHFHLMLSLSLFYVAIEMQDREI